MAMEPGKYIATVEDYGIGTSSEKKTPYLNVKFKIKETGMTVFWQQYLTSKTVDRLVDNLVETKLLQTKKFSDLADGVRGNGLSTLTEVEITVVNEEYDKDGEIKTSSKVQWVNTIGGGGMKNTLAKAEAITTLAGLNLDATINASQVRTGVTIEEPLVPGAGSEEVPF